MLNESKIKMMTKMAIYEKNEGRHMLKTAKYYKSDYVTLGVLKSIIPSTIAYILLVIMFIACNIETLVSDISGMQYGDIGRNIVVFYILFLVVFAVASGLISALEYDRSRGSVKRHFSRLSKLEHFYDRQNNRK